MQLRGTCNAIPTRTALVVQLNDLYVINGFQAPLILCYAADVKNPYDLIIPKCHKSQGMQCVGHAGILISTVNTLNLQVMSFVATPQRLEKRRLHSGAGTRLLGACVRVRGRRK